MNEEKKLNKGEKAFHWLHAWMRWYNVKFIPLLRMASVKKTKQTLREQKETYQHLKSLIESSAQAKEEPSEAEMEEFAIRCVMEIHRTVQSVGWHGNKLEQIIREKYNALREGKEGE